MSKKRVTHQRDINDASPLEHAAQGKGAPLFETLADAFFDTPEALYRTLIEQIPAMTYISAADDPGEVLFLSPQVEQHLGYSPEEWLADPHFWQTHLHPDDYSRVLAADREAVERGESYDLEYRLIHRDGHPVWIRDQGMLIRGDDGTPRCWLGFTMDMTRQKLTEQALLETEEQYRTLVERIPVVTFIEYPNGGGVPHFLSPQIESLLGRPPEQWHENRALWLQSIHPDDLPLWKAEVERTDDTGDAFNLEYRMIAADGRTVWVQSSSHLVLDDDGKPRFWQGIIQDITDEVNAEQRLAESEQRYRSLFQHHPDAVYSLDLDGNMRSANSAVVELTGYTLDEVLNMTFTPLISPVDRARVNHHFTLATSGQPQDYECTVIRKDGEQVEVHVTNLPIVVGGEIVGVYGIAKDISDRKALENQLKHLAFHDPLTDLPNRLLFMDRLEQALTALERRPGSIAVLFIDLDTFKTVNDDHGHDIGDQVLVQIADRLQSSIRAGDTISRLGGDEYTVLLMSVRDADDAADVARRILEHLRVPIVVGDVSVRVSASIGVVVSSSHTDDPADLLRDADQAMYRAKGYGKARYVVIDRNTDRPQW